MTASLEKTKRKAGRVKYVGIVSDARALGVTYPHLWQVLEGRRSSKSLMRKYRALKKKV